MEQNMDQNTEQSVVQNIDQGVVQKKKMSTFDIVNIVVLSIGLVLALITMITPIVMAKDIAVRIIDGIHFAATVIAILSAAIYMIMRYTKKSAAFYKIFMYSFVVSFAMMTLTTMTVGSGSVLNSIIVIFILLFSVVLATAKDYGKIKTYIIAGLLLIAHIVLGIVGLGAGVPMLLWPCLVHVILTVEACIMVLAKYKDKTARGTK